MSVVILATKTNKRLNVTGFITLGALPRGMSLVKYLNRIDNRDEIESAISTLQFRHRRPGRDKEFHQEFVQIEDLELQLRGGVGHGESRETVSLTKAPWLKNSRLFGPGFQHKPRENAHQETGRDVIEQRLRGRKGKSQHSR